MQIAVTGATGFVGRHVVRRLAAAGHRLRCWYRPESDRGGFDGAEGSIDWVEGALGDPAATKRLVDGSDAVVHAALHRAGPRFIGAEGEVTSFVEANVVGTLRLIETAKAGRVERFVFVSTCAVHDEILPGRPLDETHPLWPASHYGAHKAAIEAFVSSYGRGQGFPVCSLRPCGIYGVDRPVTDSKWFELVRTVAWGRPVECRRGGKEVHVEDVAKAIELLLASPADAIRGQAFNCCDRYVSEHEVATLAREFSGGDARIDGEPTGPKNVIETGKLRSLGFEFGGEARLRETVRTLVDAAR